MNSFNTAQIRKFLMEYFSDQELTALCFDYFPDVENEFTEGMAKGRKVQLLLESCRRWGRMPDLLAALQRERSDAFEEELSQQSAPEPPATVGPEEVERDPGQVFISYASQDGPFAQRLAEDLQDEGWSVWKAPESIRPGEKWVEAINRGLAESGIFVLVLSENAVNSRWVESETNVAIGLEHHGQMRFIPIALEAAKTPPIWSTYHYIPFGDDYESGRQALLRELAWKPAGEAVQGDAAGETIDQGQNGDDLPAARPSARVTVGPRPGRAADVKGVFERLWRVPALAWFVVGIALILGIWGLTTALGGSEPPDESTITPEPSPTGDEAPVSLPELQLSAGRPLSSGQWDVSWTGSGPQVTGYELQESHDDSFEEPTVYDIEAGASSRSLVHPPSPENQYHYRIRAVAGEQTGPWSDTISVVGGYYDDFTDSDSGWSIRRTTYAEETSASYGVDSEDGNLVLEVSDRWDWAIASPLAQRPDVPFAITFRSRMTSDDSLLASSGAVFGADWNGAACPDPSDIYESENCFNRFYNFNTISLGEFMRLVPEKVESLEYCPSCGGSPIKRLPGASADWPELELEVDPSGWNTWRIEVRADRIDFYVNDTLLTSYDNADLLDDPFFGLFASTDEYQQSRWLFDFYQILPLDE